jgi:hypothetical protein
MTPWLAHLADRAAGCQHPIRVTQLRDDLRRAMSRPFHREPSWPSWPLDNLAQGTDFFRKEHLVGQGVRIKPLVAQNPDCNSLVFTGGFLLSVSCLGWLDAIGFQATELILPASRNLNMERVREVLNDPEAYLATEAEMEQYFTDCELGAIPALRHWKDVDVFMDQSLNVAGDILFQAGTHKDAVRVDFRDWYELVRPQVVSFSVPAEAAYA